MSRLSLVSLGHWDTGCSSASLDTQWHYVTVCG